MSRLHLRTLLAALLLNASSAAIAVPASASPPIPPQGTYTYSVDKARVAAEGGETLTLTGSGYTSASTVTIGGVPAASTFVNSARIAAVTPQLPANGQDLAVKVTTPNAATWMAPVVDVIRTDTHTTSLVALQCTQLLTASGSVPTSFQASLIARLAPALPAATGQPFALRQLEFEVRVDDPNGSMPYFQWGDAAINALKATVTGAEESSLVFASSGSTVHLPPSSSKYAYDFPATGSIAATGALTPKRGSAGVTVDFSELQMTQNFDDYPLFRGPVNVRCVPKEGDSGTIVSVPVDRPVPEAPKVESLSKVTLPPTGGASVTINGSGFKGATSVRFGDVPATSFTIVGDGEITAVAPALPAARNVPLTVALSTLEYGVEESSAPVDIVDPATVSTFETPARCSLVPGATPNVPATLITRFDRVDAVGRGETATIRNLRIELRTPDGPALAGMAPFVLRSTVSAVVRASGTSAATPATSTLQADDGLVLRKPGPAGALAYGIPEAAPFGPLTLTPDASSTEVGLRLTELVSFDNLVTWGEGSLQWRLRCVPEAADLIARIPVTDPSPTQAAFDVKGAVTLKTLVKGSAPLAGTMSASVTSAGAVAGQLALKPTQANLTALGFLPVTAQLAFVATEPTTGTFKEGVWSSNSKLRIKLPRVTMFGIQIAGGANCQSRLTSSIPLRSTGTFSLAAGGQLAGTFAMSDLAGCGALSGIVSPLTAGKGNAIALSLTPTP